MTALREGLLLLAPYQLEDLFHAFSVL